MTNNSAPTMAELAMQLTVKRDMPVVQMSVLPEDPSKIHVFFGAAVKQLPDGLPEKGFVSKEIKPIEYHLK